MRQSYRIVVADDEPDMRDYFHKVLPRLGHKLVAVAANGRDLIRMCRETAPDLAITDLKMPDLDGIEATKQLYQDSPLPIILVSAHHDPEMCDRTETDHIMGYLVKPIKQADLDPAIARAMVRFGQFMEVQKEADSPQQVRGDRKIVERARNIVMKEANLDEEGAFEHLQNIARNGNCKLVTIAQLILADGAIPESPGP